MRRARRSQPQSRRHEHRPITTQHGYSLPGPWGCAGGARSERPTDRPVPQCAQRPLELAGIVDRVDMTRTRDELALVRRHLPKPDDQRVAMSQQRNAAPGWKLGEVPFEPDARRIEAFRHPFLERQRYLAWDFGLEEAEAARR